MVRGYVYFPGGSRAQHVPVALRNEADAEVESTVTSEDGTFAFSLPDPGVYTVTAQTQDGHAARFAVTIGGTERPPAENNTNRSISPQNNLINPGDAAESTLNTPASHEVVALVDEAVARQVIPLREEVDRLRSETRFRDVLGGLGYIAGVMGLLFWWKARHAGGGE